MQNVFLPLYLYQVRYRGPLTFLKCQKSSSSPISAISHRVADIWGDLVDGGTTHLVCPGDHFSLSELPQAKVTGGILATALAFTFRMLFPEFPTPPRMFNQRRTVGKLSRGVNVFLHSKRGNLFSLTAKIKKKLIDFHFIGIQDFYRGAKPLP